MDRQREKCSCEVASDLQLDMYARVFFSCNRNFRNVSQCS